MARKYIDLREIFRLRKSNNTEALRVGFQLCLFLSPFALLAILISLSVYGEWPWVLAFRFYEDAFGPLKDLWALKTPLVDRRRFEQPGNLWRPYVFPVDTSIGLLQVRCLQLLNRIVSMAWEGPIVVRILVWATGVIVWWAMFLFVTQTLFFVFLPWCYDQFRMRWPVAHGRVLQLYLRNLPEQCLILEQLAVAREVFGRKLSVAAEAEVKEQTARRARIEASHQQELDATVYGNRAPTSETMRMA